MATSLIKKTGLYLVGNVGSKLLSALIIPIYALYVSSGELGDYDYVYTLCSVIAPVAFLAMWEGVLKYGLGSEGAGGCVVISTAVRFSVPLAFCASCLFGLLAWIAGLTQAQGFLLALMSFANGLATLWQYCCRAQGESKVYAWSGVMASVGNFGLVLLLVCAARMQATGLAFAYVAGQLATVVFVEMRIGVVRAAVSSPVDRVLLVKMIRYSFPCVFNLLSLSLLTAVGRMAIMESLGSEANGQYAFAMKFASIVTSLGSIFSMAVIEEGILRSGTRELALFYEAITGDLSALLLSLSCVSLPVISLFYELFAGSAYAESFRLIPSVIAYAAVSVMATFFASAFMATGRTSVTMWTTLAGLGVCAIVSFGTVASFGTLASSFGLLFGSLVMMSLRMLLSMRAIGYHVKARLPIVLCLLFVVLSVALQFAFNAHDVCLEVGLLVAAGAVLAPLILKSLRGIATVPDRRHGISDV